MYRSSSFVNQCRRSLRGTPQPADVQHRIVEEQFVRALMQAPAELARELFGALVETRDDTMDELLQLLGDLVDLFAMEYDDQADPLGAPEWEILRDLVDSYAEELDMARIQYVMERVVSHGALGTPEEQ